MPDTVPPQADLDGAPPTRDALVTGMKQLLHGQDLGAVSLRDLRKNLALHLGLDRTGLDHRRDEVRNLAEHIVRELAQEDEALQDWMHPVDQDSRLMVFLVTFSAILARYDITTEPALKNPTEMTREQLRDAVLDAVANPVQVQTAGGRPRTRAIRAQKLAIAKEEHATRPGDFHFHVAVKLDSETRFLPFKESLRQRHGLASH